MLSTSIEACAKALRRSGFFNAANLPTARYMANGLVRPDATHAQVEAMLTVQGINRPAITLAGVGAGLAKDARVGVLGHMPTKRSDSGMKAFLPDGGDDVSIAIDAEFSRKT